MNQWLANLGAQERFLVIGAGVLVVLAIFYGGVWRPLSERVESLHEAVAEQRELRLWMKEAAREADRLRGTTGAATGAGGGSLLSIADRTAKQAGLGNAVRRVEPEGPGKVRIRLEQAAFDDLTSWLERLARESGVRVESITVNSGQRPGLVDARLTLEGAA